MKVMPGCGRVARILAFSTGIRSRDGSRRADALHQFPQSVCRPEAFDRAGDLRDRPSAFFDVDAGGVSLRNKSRRGRDVELATAANDAHGDFATVGNKDLPEHDGITRGLEPQLTSGSSPKVRVT